MRTWRGEKNSWGVGDYGGDGTAGVASEADGFKNGRFGGALGSGAVDRALKESDAGKGPGNREKAFVEGAIGLETNCAEVRFVATGQNSDGNVGPLWQGGDGVWKKAIPWGRTIQEPTMVAGSSWLVEVHATTAIARYL